MTLNENKIQHFADKTGLKLHKLVLMMEDT